MAHCEGVLSSCRVALPAWKGKVLPRQTVLRELWQGRAWPSRGVGQAGGGAGPWALVGWEFQAARSGQVSAGKAQRWESTGHVGGAAMSSALPGREGYLPAGDREDAGGRV